MGLDLDAGNDAAPADDATVELFRLGGHSYRIPARPKAGLGLALLRQVRSVGSLIAGSWLLEELIGPDGYQALIDHKNLTDADVEQIVAVAQGHVLGFARIVEPAPDKPTPPANGTRPTRPPKGGGAGRPT